MFPCLAFSGGNSQDAVILVDVLAATVKPLGACDGTAEIHVYQSNLFDKLSISLW